MKKREKVTAWDRNLLRLARRQGRIRARLRTALRPPGFRAFPSRPGRKAAAPGRPIFRDNPPLSLAKELRKLFPKDEEETIARAEQACAHRFEILGFGEVEAGDEIDWHRDFFSGHRWDKHSHFTRIHPAPAPGGYEIKVPWELSRFHHLITLGKAYVYSGREKYAREAREQVEHWLRENRPDYGVNWACPMDVAIRAANWIAGFGLLEGAGALDRHFLPELRAGLRAHGRHLQHNLEIFPRRFVSNHAVAEYAGLLYLGLNSPPSRAARRWTGLGRRGLAREMARQVYPDGVDFEASTAYHCQVLEFFLYAALEGILHSPVFTGTNHLEAGNNFFGSSYMNKLKRMLDFSLLLLKPNLTIPLLGDADGGGMHRFSSSSSPDPVGLLNLGAVIFREESFKLQDRGDSPGTLLCLGREGRRIWEELGENGIPALTSRGFREGGIFILRKNRDFLAVSASRGGQNGNGGHAHADKLSFELNCGGRDIIVDPGTFTYSGDHSLRNLFRSTGAHNSVVLDSREQVCFKTGNLFMMSHDAPVRVHLWKSSPERDILDAEHGGYLRLPDPIVHRRVFLFEKESRFWLLRDILTGKGLHRFVAWFHFAPGLTVTSRAGSITIAGEDGSPSFLLRVLGDTPTEISLFPAWVSPLYGARRKATAAAIAGKFRDRAGLEFYLSEARAEEEIRRNLAAAARILGETDAR